MTGPGRPQPHLISQEEKAVTALLFLAFVIAIIAAGLSLAMVYSALPRSGQPVEAGRLATALAVLVVTWLAILFAIFGRWPGRVSSETSIDVRAAPSAVWDAFALRDDYPGWKRIYTGIERLDEPGEVYRVHYAEDSDCSRCSLPRDPDRSRWSSRVEVLEAKRPSLYRQRDFPRHRSDGNGEIDRLLDSEDSAMLLQPLAGGSTRVTLHSTVVRPRMWMAFLTMLGRPGKEHLRSLKAHVEGTPDDSLFGFSARRMEAARTAAQRCNCA